MGTKCTATFQSANGKSGSKSRFRVIRRDGIGIPKEGRRWKGDARATTHPIQQPVATEGEANNAFDDITYKKGAILPPDARKLSRRGTIPLMAIRRYIRAHQYSNSTTADLWDALGASSGKTGSRKSQRHGRNKPGFPVVTVVREKERQGLARTRNVFTIGFHNASGSLWKIPITYFIDGQSAPGDDGNVGKKKNSIP